jgi:hypothetical protein
MTTPAIAYLAVLPFAIIVSVVWAIRDQRREIIRLHELQRHQSAREVEAMRLRPALDGLVLGLTWPVVAVVRAGFGVLEALDWFGRRLADLEPR